MKRTEGFDALAQMTPTQSNTGLEEHMQFREEQG